ncbi:MAG: PepSY-associated TM helix domain-containing protein [Planctomycetota bacterium]|nr:PepSY-associated TM helix domain-containing protein [Planctomycetota bacterium]
MILRRSAALVARWVHTFVSVAGFGALIFFSLTGITLNHAAYFETADPMEREFSGQIAPALLEGGAVDRLGVVEELRAGEGLRGRVVEFREDGAELLVSFEAAGFTADVYVDRLTGAYEGLTTVQGAWVLLNDLHKGRGTGGAWSWVIDVSAAVLLVCGLTGLWLLWFVKKRRRSGLAVTALGVLALPLVYVLFELA